MQKLLTFFVIILVAIPQAWSKDIPIVFRKSESRLDMSIGLPKNESYALNQSGNITTLTMRTKQKLNLKALTEQLPQGFHVESITPKENAIMLRLSTPGYRVSKHSREQHGILVKYTPDSTITSEKDLPTEKKEAQTTQKKINELVTSGRLDIVGTSKETKLIFNFPQKRAMAAFLRDGHYWFVFDSPHTMEIHGGLLSCFGKLKQRETPDVAVFELKRLPLISAHVTQEENSWIVTLTYDPDPAKPAVRNDLNGSLKFFDDHKSAYEIPMLNIGTKYDFVDPHRGDRVIVYTSSEVGRRFAKGVEFADFEIVPSLQGVAVTTLVPDLALSQGKNLITIRRPGGLHVSSMEDRKGSIEHIQEAHTLDFNKWVQPGKDYIKTRNEMDQWISSAPISERVEAYFALIRYNLAHGYGPEALRLLSLLSDDVPGLLHDPHFLSLQGVGHFLAGNTQLALHDFTSRELEPIKDIKLWKGAALNNLKQTALGTELMEKHKKQIEALPPFLKVKVTINAAMGALDMKRTKLAEEYAAMLHNTPIAEGQKQDYELFQAYLAERNGDLREAKAQFSKISKDHDGKTGAMAEIEMVRRDLETDRIDVHQAIKRLEAMRYSWHGSELEWTLLSDLADLYVKAEDYKNALSTMSIAMKYHPDEPDFGSMQKLMTETFIKLFSPETQKTISPVSSVSLYQSFKSLTPKGKKGDDVIISLAHNLQDLELPEEARKALAERFNNATSFNSRLAMEYITALLALKDSKKALELIKKTEPQKLTQEERQQLKYLKVKALASLGHYDQGLKLLHNDTSEIADQLKANLYWKAGKLELAAQNLKKAIDQQKGRRPELLMSYALALYKVKDTQKLVALRKQYRDKVTGTKFEQPFNILTSSNMSKDVKLNQREAHLAQVADFEKLLDVSTK